MSSSPLPREIVLQVVRCVKDEPTLRHLCLVNRATCHFAREVLYRRVTLKGVRYTRHVCSSESIPSNIKVLDASIFAMIPSPETQESLNNIHEDYEINHIQAWAVTFSLMLGSLLHSCRKNVRNLEFDSFTGIRPSDALFAYDAGDIFAGVCTSILKNFQLLSLDRLILTSFRFFSLADLWYFPLDSRCFSPPSNPLIVKQNLGSLQTFKIRQLWYEDGVDEDEAGTYEDDFYHHVLRLMKLRRFKFQVYGPFRLSRMSEQVGSTWDRTLSVLSLENLTVVDGGLSKLLFGLTSLGALKLREVHLLPRSGERWAATFKACRSLEILKSLKLCHLRYGTNYAYDDDKPRDVSLAVCTMYKSDLSAFTDLCRELRSSGALVSLGFTGPWVGDEPLDFALLTR